MLQVHCVQLLAQSGGLARWALKAPLRAVIYSLEASDKVVGPGLSIHHWETLKMTRLKKMKLMLAVLISMGAASAATAQAVVEDTDGDGMYSMEELLAVFPALTEERYGEVDANGDGMVDAEELAVAQEAGLLAAG